VCDGARLKADGLNLVVHTWASIFHRSARSIACIALPRRTVSAGQDAASLKDALSVAVAESIVVALRAATTFVVTR